ncbi:MAG: universal stress protein [Deltaproteobacteria bacterium]|nr:universal stress protein [Deltaproteobacteria bacterium]
MYKKILFCLDNSGCANSGVDLGLAIAASSGSAVAGCHVYAARLHNERFRQMEGGLPPKYRAEDALRKQREVHDTLITRGLKIISDSYAAPFLAKARSIGLEAAGISREGKNFEELVLEAGEGGYGLAVIGAQGLGSAGKSLIGSVCERVARRVTSDVLVAREAVDEDGPILVAVDGSPHSYGGLKAAFELSKIFHRPVEAVSVFDPQFHQSAFRAIAGVLSEEAGRMFRFKEQEKLHEEIIDKGLARIYRDHLDSAMELGREAGIPVKATLLSGKASHEIIGHANKTRAFMLVAGRTGAHSSPSLDIGSVTENCLREARCHILISSRRFTPKPKRTEGVRWSDEAKRVLEGIPAFARGVVKLMAEEAARKDNVAVITPAYMREVRERMEG